MGGTLMRSLYASGSTLGHEVRQRSAMRIRLGLLIVAAGLCTLSCARLDPDASPPRVDGASEGPGVYLRVHNASDIDFDSLTVEFPIQTEEFGTLAAGEASDYRLIDGAYRYAYAEARHRDQLYVLQPIDFVGESFLRPGTYTYHFEVQVSEDPLSGPDRTIHGYMDVKVERDSDDRPRPDR